MKNLEIARLFMELAVKDIPVHFTREGLELLSTLDITTDLQQSEEQEASA